VADYDSIVIGAGHNGLVCAGYLAKAGQRVLVLEAAPAPGGLAAQREFHEGFRTPLAHSAGRFPATIVRDLDLATHGFRQEREPIATIGLRADGDPLVIRADTVAGCGESDQAAYRNYTALMDRFAAALAPFWLKTIPRIGGNSLAELLTFGHLGLNLRRLGRQDMREFLRIASLPMRDLMDEYFDDETLKAVLSWDGLIGGKMAPRSPNGAVLAMLYRRAGNPAGAHTLAADGVARLVHALAAAAGANGAELRCASPVRRILIEEAASGIAATGVELADGEIIRAGRVVSSADPKSTFLGMVGVGNLDIGFTNRIRRLRSDGYVARLHLALEGVPKFRGLDRPDGRLIMAPRMDALEFAFDEAKYGGCPDEPVVELTLPSLSDPSLAPEGRHVLSAHVMYVPRHLKGGWSDEAKDALCRRAVATIARHAPGIEEQILQAELLTPEDLEREYRVTGGHWHHGEFAMDQILMMRPTYEAAQYATPIPGLHLCGAGCHPGGDVTGAAGHNAAREILR